MELQSLYQDIILDHFKHPRSPGLLPHPMGEAHHVNPTCGDEVTVQVALDDDTLVIGYQGVGCSISQASASVLSELVSGDGVAHAEEVRKAFLDLMHRAGTPDEELLGDAIAFAGVANFPARVKCALLPWMAFQDAEVRAGLLDRE